jgi:hypothetical protein
VSDERARGLERQAAGGDDEAALQLSREVVRAHGDALIELVIPHLVRLQRYVFALAAKEDPVRAFHDEPVSGAEVLAVLRDTVKAWPVPGAEDVAPPLTVSGPQGAPGPRGIPGPPGAPLTIEVGSVPQEVRHLILPDGCWINPEGGDGRYRLEFPKGPCSHRGCKREGDQRCGGHSWPHVNAGAGCCGRMFCYSHVQSYTLDYSHESHVCQDCREDEDRRKDVG